MFLLVLFVVIRGGTPAEAWVKEETLERDDKLRPILDNYRKVAIMDDTLYEKKMRSIRYFIGFIMTQ